jgi:hypothetical protein
MNFVHIAASAVIIPALMSVCANAKPIATARDTNLRQEPRMDGQILTLIPGGTKIEVGQCVQGWCKASWNGQDGYVAVQNLAFAKGATAGRACGRRGSLWTAGGLSAAACLRAAGLLRLWALLSLWAVLWPQRLLWGMGLWRRLGTALVACDARPIMKPTIARGLSSRAASNTSKAATARPS